MAIFELCQHPEPLYVQEVQQKWRHYPTVAWPHLTVPVKELFVFTHGVGQPDELHARQLRLQEIHQLIQVLLEILRPKRSPSENSFFHCLSSFVDSDPVLDGTALIWLS